MTLKTFKQYLLEEVGEEESIQIPPSLITQYKGRLQISENNKLNSSLSFSIPANTGSFIDKNRELRYPFDVIDGGFNADHLLLSSFKNFPRIIKGNFTAYLNKFTNVEDFPEYVEGNIDISSNKHLKSLSGIHKNLKECNGKLTIPADLKGGMLGLLKVKGLKKVTFDEDEVSEHQIPELAKACEIIAKYLNSDRNLIACQKELYDNDLDDFAEL
jgi:hypothetical protein